MHHASTVVPTANVAAGVATATAAGAAALKLAAGCGALLACVKAHQMYAAC
jgi:hypothetical protein